MFRSERFLYLLLDADFGRSAARRRLLIDRRPKPVQHALEGELLHLDVHLTAATAAAADAATAVSTPHARTQPPHATRARTHTHKRACVCGWAEGLYVWADKGTAGDGGYGEGWSVKQ